MRVVRNKVEGVAYAAARNIGGVIAPQIVILHDTAGPLAHGSSARYLRENRVGVSVHFVIERDGSIEQQVPLNRRAGHAGKSSFEGRPDCNAFSIGIELVNPGRMSRLGDYQAVSWWGEVFDIEKHALVAAETPEHGKGIWMGYAEPQLAALLQLLQTLFRDVPRLSDIATHWQVSPGRKVDTNPLFPLESVRARILGRDDPADARAEAASDAVPPATLRRVNAGTAGLNMRRWPSFNPNVLASIPSGTVVPVLREGRFADRRWSLVQFAGLEGWIVTDPYTELA